MKYLLLVSAISLSFYVQAQSTDAQNQSFAEFRQVSNVSFLPGKGTTSYPQYKNGKQGLAEYIENEIKYPDVAKNENVHGLVIVEYTIGKDGNVSNVGKAKGSIDSDALVNELIRVVEKSGPWLPGTVEDKPEKMKLKVSYNF